MKLIFDENGKFYKHVVVAHVPVDTLQKIIDNLKKAIVSGFTRPIPYDDVLTATAYIKVSIRELEQAIRQQHKYVEYTHAMWYFGDSVLPYDIEKQTIMEVFR